MTPDLAVRLLAIAGLCLGFAVLIGHDLAARILAVAGTIVFGVVLLYSFIR